MKISYFPEGTKHGVGRVVNFPRALGSEVAAGDVVVEVESGPSTVLEVQTPHTGTVTKMLRKTGDSVRSGEPIVELQVSFADYARGWWRSLEVDTSMPKR